MPELPEVETIARTLAPQVEGRCVTACHLLNPGTLQGDVPLTALIGRRFATPARRGKLLLLPLVDLVALDSPDAQGAPDAQRAPLAVPPAGGLEYVGQAFSPDSLACLLPQTLIGLGMHLKMTGRVFVHPAGTEPGPHTRAVFDLDDGLRVFFDDARKFGYIRLLTPAAFASWPFWTRLGPEPLDIGAEAFAARFATRSAAIKALLLDQTLLAGCGNIYADESLFRAGIRPEAKGNSLSPERLHRLHQALQEVLYESIAACGSSIRDYRTARGDAGAFQNAFRVYGRGGKKCFACESALRSCRVAGRSTVYCPHCQK